MSSLKLSGVNKVYPSGNLALYDINLEAQDKEFLVVIGGEASGKSTLLRTVAGLEDLSSGEIFIGDKNVTEEDPKDRDIAMIFRNDSLNPSLSVYDNLAFGLKLRKAPQALIDGRVKAAAAVLGLSEVLSRKPKTLTSAQRQRAAIGRAIVREPKVYLFDEPLSGLDENLKGELLNVIINLQARMQGTFVYATKNVAEAMTIGTRIVILKNGIVQQVDAPCNLYDYPENAYVAFLIGSPSINFINNAVIEKGEEGYFAVQGEFKVKLSKKTVSRFADIEKYAGTGKPVIIGIRPEDIVTGKEGEAAEIIKTECDGGEYYAECKTGAHTLTVKTQQNAKAGGVKLSFDGDRLYIFDYKTRLTLLGRDGGYVNTGMPQSDLKPMPFDEENVIIEKSKPAKDNKKKRK